MYIGMHENHEIFAYQFAESVVIFYVTVRKSCHVRVPIIITVQSTQYSITNIRRGALYNERVYMHVHLLVTQCTYNPLCKGGLNHHSQKEDTVKNRNHSTCKYLKGYSNKQFDIWRNTLLQPPRLTITDMYRNRFICQASLLRVACE